MPWDGSRVLRAGSDPASTRFGQVFGIVGQCPKCSPSWLMESLSVRIHWLHDRVRASNPSGWVLDLPPTRSCRFFAFFYAMQSRILEFERAAAIGKIDDAGLRSFAPPRNARLRRVKRTVS